MIQSTQLQIEKLNLIEKIIHIEDENLIAYLNAMLLENTNEYKLSVEDLSTIEESRSKYLSSEDKGKSWDEVKSNLLKKRDERL
ncbi:hypothetical protein [Flavobacterium muglaense]|uniref:Addiction module component n=1 Tax=Flavobacterium muglaense TaxID=2764716 RepID=A0A923SDV1_9FLAO|nr:hypothetical protein [Flavobacterium muglaense]MBC5836317.1 hypothetical protein [Flavobacterium muglaense]MBC5842847.1 hypothetical protein [Flavobacterium muglaense]